MFAVFSYVYFIYCSFYIRSGATFDCLFVSLFVCLDLFTQLSVSLFAGFTYSPNAVSTQSPGDPVQICGGVFENMSGHADELALCIQHI